ncbi:MAG: sigma 54-interacting transcriptional regulator, partial [Desulfomonile tiedjei]|nr:sigma 54-interacting transcriptional regulator [Desulfomonile tiedjei]
MTGTLFEKCRYLFEKWRRGEVCQFTRTEDIPDEARDVKSILTKFGAKSHLSIPITLAGSTAGAFTVATTRHHRTWSEDLIPRLRLFGEVFINAMARKRSEEKLQEALSEIRKLKDRIEADYVYLREEIKLEHDFSDIVGKSDVLKKILLKVRQVAPTNATVLILGETGTGKGLIARAVHNASARKERPLIQVNCAVLAGSLIESELFGHEKGAFTGAQANRAGRFEMA